MIFISSLSGQLSDSLCLSVPFRSFLLFSSSDLAGEGGGRGRRKWCSGEARWTGGVRDGAAAAGQRLVRHGGAEGQVIMQ